MDQKLNTRTLTRMATLYRVITSDKTFQTVYDTTEEEEKMPKEKSQFPQKIFQKLKWKLRKKL